MAIPEDLIFVGHVLGAYGVHGWVRVRPYSTNADALLHAKVWWLDKPFLHDVDMRSARLHGGDVIAQLTGVSDRDAAENLKGSVVQIPRSRFPVLDDNEFYWVDLIGLSVENKRGLSFGRVVSIMECGAHPILQVADVDQKSQEILIPFVAQFIQTIDQAAKKIVVDWESDY